MLIKAETALAAVLLCLERVAELLRELAVLVLVFLPLDLWRGQMTNGRTAAILFTCGGFFTLGLGCEWVFLTLKARQGGREHD